MLETYDSYLLFLKFSADLSLCLPYILTSTALLCARSGKYTKTSFFVYPIQFLDPPLSLKTLLNVKTLNLRWLHHLDSSLKRNIIPILLINVFFCRNISVKGIELTFPLQGISFVVIIFKMLPCVTVSHKKNLNAMLLSWLLWLWLVLLFKQYVKSKQCYNIWTAKVAKGRFCLQQVNEKVHSFLLFYTVNHFSLILLS